MALVAAFRSASVAAADRSGDQRTPLALVVDGVAKSENLIVIVRATDVLVLETDLAAAGVPLAGAVFVDLDGTRYVSLASLGPGTTFTIDPVAIALDIHVDPALLQHSDIQVGDLTTHVLAKADSSAFVSYSVTSGTGDERRNTNAYVQAGAGNAAAGLLTASASYSDDEAHRGLIAYRRENETKLSSLTVGDEYASTGDLGANVVVGGFGATRHFEFQPDYAYFPTPGLRGQVLSPTTADLYINGTLVRSVQLSPGTFDLSDISVGPGAGVTQVVLHDAYGNTQTLSGAYYETRQLLRKGVTDYDYHVGFLRPDPFERIDNYGPLAALGEYRLGVSNALTVGGRFERTAGITSGGPQIDLALPIGHASFEASVSSAFGATGRAFGVAYDYFTRRFGLSVSAETQSANYATASLAVDAARQRSSLHESFGLPIFHNASLDVSNTTSTFTDETPTSQLSAELIVRPPRLREYLTVSAERDKGGSIFGFLDTPLTGSPAPSPGSPTRTTFGVQLTFLTGKSSEATIGTTTTAGATSATLAITKPAPLGPGFGYQIEASDGAERRAISNVLYQTQFGNIAALSNSGTGPSSTSFTLSGAVVAFRKGLFLTEPVNGGYALVDVPGFAHLPVFLDGQYAGRTNGRDEAVVANLSPYYNNDVGIDDLRNRLDLSEDFSSQNVRPKNYSGVVTNFAIHHFHAYAGHIVVDRGGKSIIPTLGQVVFTLGGHEYTSDLGREGQFYVENLEAGKYSATVTTIDGLTCAFAIAFVADANPVTTLGTVKCVG